MILSSAIRFSQGRIYYIIFIFFVVVSFFFSFSARKAGSCWWAVSPFSCVCVIDGKRDGGGTGASHWGVKWSTTICQRRLCASLSVAPPACCTKGLWEPCVSLCASARNLDACCSLCMRVCVSVSVSLCVRGSLLEGGYRRGSFALTYLCQPGGLLIDKAMGRLTNRESWGSTIMSKLICELLSADLLKG